ncbi:MAG: hypothetical protein EOO01_33195 [Chitinophagaceae bacterium]|nr:MAG: hypothetical protein EOO01_33195 [Chitinophagaceae bacterium]
MKNPVKERIKMLFTNPSKSMKKLIYLALVPACLALVYLFGVQVVYAETNPKAPGNLPTNQGVTEYRVNQARPELTISKPNDDSKQALPDTKKESEAPLRLIDNVELGENPLVFIDGKEYSAEILTRISPACMSMAKFSPGKAEISTRKNQIEYATKAEIKTAKIRRQIKAKGKFYSRYPVTINGHKRDEILVRFGSHFTEGSFPVGYRIALSMNGKIFSEKEALEMEGNYAYNMTGINYRYIKEEPELFSKYGDEYDLILQFKSADTGLKSQRSGMIPGSSKITSQSGDEKFEYRATDSVAYSGNNQFITLFGNAEIINGRRSTVAGDKIRFDAKARTAIVQNARVTFQGKKKTIEGALIKVDIDKGTYEMLSGTPEF